MSSIAIVLEWLLDFLIKYGPLILSIISICFSLKKNKFDKFEKNRIFLLDMQKEIRRLIKCIDDIYDLDLNKGSIEYYQYDDIYDGIHEVFDELITHDFPSEHKLPSYNSSENNLSNGYYQKVYETAKQIDHDISESINKINRKQFKTIQH